MFPPLFSKFDFSWALAAQPLDLGILLRLRLVAKLRLRGDGLAAPRVVGSVPWFVTARPVAEGRAVAIGVVLAVADAALLPELPAVALLPELPAVALLRELPAVALLPELPAVALLPELPAVALLPAGAAPAAGAVPPEAAAVALLHELAPAAGALLHKLPVAATFLPVAAAQLVAARVLLLAMLLHGLLSSP